MRSGNNHTLGILLLILSTISLAAVDTTGKWIMAAGLPALVVSWFRYIVHCTVTAVLIFPRQGKYNLKTKQPIVQLIRGTAMVCSTLSLLTALHYLPQADATAISFIAPLLVLMVAPLLLKERLKLSRWVAALAGFSGVLLIIRPSAGLNPIGIFFAIITAILFATLYIVNRKLAKENPIITLFWSGIIGLGILTITMPLVITQTLPTLAEFSFFEWLVLLSVGIFGTLGHLLQINAFQNAPASALSPFAYVKIVSAILLGWLVWNHLPDFLSWIGIIIICMSGIILTLLERKGR